MTEPVDGTKAYLEYLDKEMTIMGILSTFCVAAAALVIDRVGSAEHDSFFGGLAKSHIVQVLIGSGLLMLAGLYFYLQRSTLAYFYGSICMSIAKRAGNNAATERWLIEVDSWATWLRYRLGFMFLTLAAVFFMFLTFQTICPSRPPGWAWFEGLLLATIALGFFLHNVILSAYRYEDDPTDAFTFHHFLTDWRKRGQGRE
jgi:hypothetical protein